MNGFSLVKEIYKNIKACQSTQKSLTGLSPLGLHLIEVEGCNAIWMFVFDLLAYFL